LADQLRDLGLETARFKTGTPPRVDGRTVDFSRCDAQPSEIEEFDYSWSHFWRWPRVRDGISRHPSQRPCWITWAGPASREIIHEAINRSAMYGGAISSRGPRYCPSIEDKIVKFPLAERHQLFLEPEGADTEELYVNGLSTSLPVADQIALLRSVPGLEHAEMTRAGYAIEYDYVIPTQLDATLAVKATAGLYLAGQINGTTGYEEAAGQGAVAGLNAARFARGREPVRFGRESSYLGVLVDDLVTRGVDEPYRLFTSRAEYRLTIRQDNALARLAPVAMQCGLYNESEAAVAEARFDAHARVLALADELSVTPDAVNEWLVARGTSPLPHAVPARTLARRNEVSLSELFIRCGTEHEFPREVMISADLEIKYAGYFARERAAADRLRQMGAFVLDPSLPYDVFSTISYEARQKLGAVRPGTLAQAASIPGVSPADLQHLVIEVERRRRRAATTADAPA
jgi:tRNA uridine 5-carboxymethylaminomethyl modification enzyme